MVTFPVPVDQQVKFILKLVGQKELWEQIFTEFTWATRGRGKSVKCFSSIEKLLKFQMDEISYLQGLTLVTQGFLN